MEPDTLCHDWIHYNQYGRYDCLDHCPTKRFDPSRLVYRFQPHASFRSRQSRHLLDVVSKFRWIHQEIVHLRSDLYVMNLSLRNRADKQSWAGQAVMP